jgi:hypothetical protein
MNVIKSNLTTGLCGVCYRELLAKIEYRSDGAAYITKTCPVHGHQEAMVEKSYEFWDTVTQTVLDLDNECWINYNNTGVIESTDRCNVTCKHCYHNPNNTIEDKPLEWIVQTAKSSPEGFICLMGAEPTMRGDLPELISEIRKIPYGDSFKQVSIYTNGIKLQNKDYVKKLKNSDISSVNMSIHHPNYHSEIIWKNVSMALRNVIEEKIQLGQISFVVENKEQVNHAIDKILWIGQNNIQAFNYCIRSPAQIGIPFIQEREIFASEIYQWISEIAKERGLSFKIHENYGSNPYHVATLLEDNIIQVIHWASVNSLDTSYMNMGPWASFIPNTRGTLLLQVILRDGWKKGWWQGQKLI